MKKVPAFFVVMGICIQKNNEYKSEINKSSTNKTVQVLPILNSGSFSIIKSTITQKVLRRSKNQKLKQE